MEIHFAEVTQLVYRAGRTVITANGKYSFSGIIQTHGATIVELILFSHHVFGRCCCSSWPRSCIIFTDFDWVRRESVSVCTALNIG